MTNGHNVIILFTAILPIGLVVFLVILKLFGVVTFSWWYVIVPLFFVGLSPFLMKFSPTGREVFESNGEESTSS